MNNSEFQIHNIEPYYNYDSKILILGSFPSVKSREVGFYYGHPQNRFWKVLAAVYEDSIPSTIEKKKKFLKVHKIALWDVIGSCEITGSSDSSIKNIEVNPVGEIIPNTEIKKIIANGKTAEKLYKKYLNDKINLPFESLPSTSPANASYSLEKLTKLWNKSIKI